MTIHSEAEKLAALVEQKYIDSQVRVRELTAEVAALKAKQDDMLAELIALRSNYSGLEGAAVSWMESTHRLEIVRANLQAKLDASENVPMAVFDDCLTVCNAVLAATDHMGHGPIDESARRVLEWNDMAPREKGPTDG